MRWDMLTKPIGMQVSIIGLADNSLSMNIGSQTVGQSIPLPSIANEFYVVRPMLTSEDE